MDYFEQILNDKAIVEIYEKVHEYEDEHGGHAHHDLSHVLNVTAYCEKILRALKYDEDFICEAKVAALLHDTGAVQGKENHAYRSFEFAKKYFDENNIQLKNKDLVLEAIKNHGDGFDTDNIIQLVLILADKIDLKKSRVSEAGKQVEGIRQSQYIDDIEFDIGGGGLKINFVCDKKMDLEELNNYYFTKKVFKAIRAFSSKLNLAPSVCVNNKPWLAFYESSEQTRDHKEEKKN